MLYVLRTFCTRTHTLSVYVVAGMYFLLYFFLFRYYIRLLLLFFCAFANNHSNHLWIYTHFVYRFTKCERYSHVYVFVYALCSSTIVMRFAESWFIMLFCFFRYSLLFRCSFCCWLYWALRLVFCNVECRDDKDAYRSRSRFHAKKTFYAQIIHFLLLAVDAFV